MFAKYFDRTLKHFGIKGTELAAAYLCVPDYISKIRRGKRMMLMANFWRLLQTMDALHPGSLEYFGCLIAGRENGFDVEEIVASLDPEEIIHYIANENLEEFSAAINYRLRNLPSVSCNYIDMADKRVLPLLIRSLIRRLKEENRLHILVAEIPEEDLGILNVAIAQRMSKIDRQQREDLKAIGAID